MNEQTRKLLDGLYRQVEASPGNAFAAGLCVRILTADDPDAEAAKVIEAVQRTGRLLAAWSRENRETIRQAVEDINREAARMQAEIEQDRSREAARAEAELEHEE